MSKKFCNILVVHTSFLHLYHITKVVQAMGKVPAVVGCAMVIGVVICWALLHSVYDLKATQMNVQHNLICKLMHYDFELGHNALKATKNFCCMRSDGIINHSTFTRWVKKFCSFSK